MTRALPLHRHCHYIPPPLPLPPSSSSPPATRSANPSFLLPPQIISPLPKRNE
ncbi:hypothetical protein P167DRAFT_538181 [Morchella conica CCBAS932]|uniref:Uncharacterized protein n=1 Tax=Morchella conica CCBAS932 TaxID=1392247 RepID=A0A3N4KKA0_9PEZI|nr:hypothetical protein P167DRAFT_538181 [Morchella conica CCBAS932]